MKNISLIFGPGLKAGIILFTGLSLASCGHHDSSGKVKLALPDSAAAKTVAKNRKDSAQFFVDLSGATEKIKSDSLLTSALPGTVAYQGKPVKIRTWKDKLGENLLLLTETGEYASKDSVEYPDNRDAALHVYHYLKHGDVYELVTKVNDFITSCPVDIATNFIPGALFITDLDGNGIAECSFAYRLTCTGGVDNKEMKLILLENKKKYAIRGTTTVYAGEKIPGKMKADKGIPQHFSRFMTEMWGAFETEHN